MTRRVFPVRAALATFTIALLLLAFGIAAYGLTAMPGHADAALVFGNTVERSGEPSRRLAARLEAARGLFVANRVRWIVVSGGVGKEGFDEARVMRRSLLAQGIPDSVLIEDGHGANTLASCLNARVLLEPRGARSVILVSQYFHLARAAMTARRAGLDVAGGAAPRYYEARDAWSLARETIALPAYALRLALMRRAEINPAVAAQAGGGS